MNVRIPGLIGCVRVVRASQAEILTVAKDYKYKPTDIRVKKTRAIRQRLSKSEVRRNS